MNHSHTELPNLHCHFDRWIEADENDRLSRKQKHVLNRHLSECTICMRRCESEKTLAELEAKLEADGVFDPAFETCRVMGFEQDLQYEAERPRLPIASRLRLLVAMTALLIVLAHVMNPGIGNLLANNSLVAAAQQMILNSPDYSTITTSAMIAAEYHLPLAALHKLTTMLTEMLAWIVLFFGLRHLLLTAIRRRVHAEPINATTL